MKESAKLSNKKAIFIVDVALPLGCTQAWLPCTVP